MTPEELAAARAQRIYGMFQKLESDCIERICRRLKKIGEVLPSDTHRLKELSRIGRDVDAIEKEIAETVGKSQTEIRELLNAGAVEEYDGTKRVFDELDAKWVPFEKNEQARTLVNAITNTVNENIADVTGVGLSPSISGTTVAADMAGFMKNNKTFMSLSQYYQDTVDYAIMQVSNGQTDFYSAMRKSIKDLSDNGMCYFDDNPASQSFGRRYVTYPSKDGIKQGYKRRLDTSARTAFMGGQQRVSRQIAALQGESFGADGMEISWHIGARPTHVDFAGKQYSMADYNRVCVPLLNEFNCYHRSFPIVLGISTPAISPEELARRNAEDAKTKTFEGKEYNAYEARQMQRRLETAIRQQKDRANAFHAAGDKSGELTAKGMVTTLSQEYKAFSGAMGLAPKTVRAAVPGYRGETTKEKAARLKAESEKNTPKRKQNAQNANTKIERTQLVTVEYNSVFH